MIYFHIIKFYKWIDDISIEFDCYFVYRFEDLTINKQDLDKECTRLQQTILELDATCQVL